MAYRSMKQNNTQAFAHHATPQGYKSWGSKDWWLIGATWCPPCTMLWKQGEQTS